MAQGPSGSGREADCEAAGDVVTVSGGVGGAVANQVERTGKPDGVTGAPNRSDGR